VIDSAVDKSKKETILRNLKRNKLTIEEIAEDNDVTIELVLAVQKELEKEQNK
jgi:predicted transposase YdaD